MESSSSVMQGAEEKESAVLLETSNAHSVILDNSNKNTVNHTGEARLAENANRFKRMAEIARDILDGRKKNLITSMMSPSFPRVGKNEQGVKLRKAARVLVVERMMAEGLDDHDIHEVLWPVLKKYSNVTPTGVNPKWWNKHETKLRSTGALLWDYYIDSISYEKAAQELGPKFKAHLTSKLFAEILEDAEPLAKLQFRIPTDFVCRYVRDKMVLRNLWLELCQFDCDGSGFITDEGLMSFFQQMPVLQEKVENIQQEFHKYFFTVVTRRILFFLDYQQMRRVRIIDLIVSFLFSEIRTKQEDESAYAEPMNWFAVGTAMAIYSHFCALDKDKNGLLTKEEFQKFDLRCINPQATITRLTKTFVNQFFIETETHKMELDFKGFVDFVVAMTCMNESQSISYFIRILDCGTKKKGYLDESDFYFFLREIQDETKNNKCRDERAVFVDIKNELFDMVKPKDYSRLTKEDLLKCGKANSVLLVLIDLEAYKNDDLSTSTSSPQVDSVRHCYAKEYYNEVQLQKLILQRIPKIPPPLSLQEEMRIEEEKTAAKKATNEIDE